VTARTYCELRFAIIFFFLPSSSFSCRQSEKTCDGNERKIGHLFDVSTLLLFDNPTEHFLRFCFQAPSIAPAVDLNFSFLDYPNLTANGDAKEESRSI
jgi:hypothetical protein